MPSITVTDAEAMAISSLNAKLFVAPQPPPPNTIIPVPADPYCAKMNPSYSNMPYVDPSVILPNFGSMNPNEWGVWLRSDPNVAAEINTWIRAIGVPVNVQPFISQGMGLYPTNWTLWQTYRALQQGLDSNESRRTDFAWSPELRSWYHPSDGTLYHQGPPDPMWDEVTKRITRR